MDLLKDKCFMVESFALAMFNLSYISECWDHINVFGYLSNFVKHSK